MFIHVDIHSVDKPQGCDSPPQRDESLEDAAELFEPLFGLSRVGRIGHAPFDMVVENPYRNAIESSMDRGDLREDVDAVFVLVDHPSDPANLALDTRQPL